MRVGWGSRGWHGCWTICHCYRSHCKVRAVLESKITDFTYQRKTKSVQFSFLKCSEIIMMNLDKSVMKFHSMDWQSICCLMWGVFWELSHSLLTAPEYFGFHWDICQLTAFMFLIIMTCIGCHYALLLNIEYRHAFRCTWASFFVFLFSNEYAWHGYGHPSTQHLQTSHILFGCHLHHALTMHMGIRWIWHPISTPFLPLQGKKKKQIRCLVNTLNKLEYEELRKEVNVSG